MKIKIIHIGFNKSMIPISWDFQGDSILSCMHDCAHASIARDMLVLWQLLLFQILNKSLRW